MKSKIEIRKWAKEERKKLDLETLSLDLVNKLKQTDAYLNAKDIMLYYPLEYEINLLSLLDDNTKNFYLPKIVNENLLCCPYSLGDELCVSCFKTQEPIAKDVDKTILDLVIVPALAVDKNNYRLGYGGGFYDRFLYDLNTYNIVCISEKFILDTVYPEKFDIKINEIISA